LVADAGHDSKIFVETRAMLSGGDVVRARLQPFEIIPAASEAASTTNKLQAPVGSMFLNVLSEAGAFEFPAGAEGGKSYGRFVWATDGSRYPFVGLNVPEFSRLFTGSELAALSSRVKRRFVTATLGPLCPPTRLMRTQEAPFGAVRRMLMSLGNACVRPYRDTVTLVTAWPLTPETLISEGYGEAFANEVT